jgi:transcriptional regulator with GAF, ATPase, and Fis domain
VEVRDVADRVPIAAQIVRRANAAKTDIEQHKPARSTAADRRRLLSDLMRKHGGNLAAVSRELGKSRSQVYRWLARLGIARERFR